MNRLVLAFVFILAACGGSDSEYKIMFKQKPMSMDERQFRQYVQTGLVTDKTMVWSPEKKAWILAKDDSRVRKIRGESKSFTEEPR